MDATVRGSAMMCQHYAIKIENTGNVRCPVRSWKKWWARVM